MYPSGNGISVYKQTNVTTADPKKQILMCYEGLISNLKTAKQKILLKDFESKGKSIQKTQDILSLLMQSLDFKKGGAVAKNLDALYNYMSRRLIEADLNKDIVIMDEVIILLEELESAWKEILHGQKRGEVNDTMPLRRAGAY